MADDFVRRGISDGEGGLGFGSGRGYPLSVDVVRRTKEIWVREVELRGEVTEGRLERGRRGERHGSKEGRAGSESSTGEDGGRSQKDWQHRLETLGIIGEKSRLER